MNKQATDNAYMVELKKPALAYYAVCECGHQVDATGPELLKQAQEHLSANSGPEHEMHYMGEAPFGELPKAIPVVVTGRDADGDRAEGIVMVKPRRAVMMESGHTGYLAKVAPFPARGGAWAVYFYGVSGGGVNEGLSAEKAIEQARTNFQTFKQHVPEAMNQARLKLSNAWDVGFVILETREQREARDRERFQNSRNA